MHCCLQEFSHKLWRGWQPCLEPGLWGQDFSFSLLSMYGVSCRFVVNGFNYTEEEITIPTYWGVFKHERDWVLSAAFSAFTDTIVWFLSFLTLSRLVFILFGADVLSCADRHVYTYV